MKIPVIVFIILILLAWVSGFLVSLGLPKDVVVRYIQVPVEVPTIQLVPIGIQIIQQEPQ